MSGSFGSINVGKKISGFYLNLLSSQAPSIFPVCKNNCYGTQMLLLDDYSSRYQALPKGEKCNITFGARVTVRAAR